jgi:hypothetical protein
MGQDDRIDHMLGPAELPEPPAEPPVEAPEEPSEEIEPQEITLEAEPSTEEPPKRKRTMLDDLREERSRRQELQHKIQTMEAQWQAFMAGQQGAVQPKPSEATPEPEPNKEDDPLGWFEYQNRVLNERLARIEASSKQSAEANQQLGQFQQFQSKVAADEAAYAKQNPHYKDAALYVMGRRKAELEALGLAPHEVQYNLANEVAQVAGRAYASGKNPAEFAYEMALKLGYKPKTGDAVVELPTSLAQASAAPSGKVSARSDLSKMSDADFDKLFQRMSGGG